MSNTYLSTCNNDLDTCNKKTDDEYIIEYINNWKDGKQIKSSNSGLLDFIKLLIIQKSNPNILVRDWCNSCVTIRKNPLGYLTMSGALGFSSNERPIYYLKNDQDPSTQLSKYNFNPQTGKWSDFTWVNVIVRQPYTEINIDSGLNISLRTVRCTVPNSTQTEPAGDYYYLFIVNPTCGKLPMPVYQYVGDFSNLSTTPINSNWPLINKDGNTFNSTLTKCPSDCTNWKWL